MITKILALIICVPVIIALCLVAIICPTEKYFYKKRNILPLCIVNNANLFGIFAFIPILSIISMVVYLRCLLIDSKMLFKDIIENCQSNYQFNKAKHHFKADKMYYEIIGYQKNREIKIFLFDSRYKKYCIYFSIYFNAKGDQFVYVLSPKDNKTIKYSNNEYICIHCFDIFHKMFKGNALVKKYEYCNEIRYTILDRINNYTDVVDSAEIYAEILEEHKNRIWW